MTTATEMPELSAKERRSRNWLVALFVALAVFATVVLVCGVLSRIYPDSGIPFIWIAFPVGPQPAPIP
ncbi:MAG: hypothetical protein BMS9Abin18_0186 [Zetaproteobacteria bacterium]|nr:MAG: hypothetical protein BMS9Abin18_0186 [Zetaproteobacteria bacterium]